MCLPSFPLTCPSYTYQSTVEANIWHLDVRICENLCPCLVSVTLFCCKCFLISSTILYPGCEERLTTNEKKNQNFLHSWRFWKYYCNYYYYYLKVSRCIKPGRFQGLAQVQGHNAAVWDLQFRQLSSVYG